MFRQAMWLAKKEIKYHWVALLFTAMATVFIALFTANFLRQSVLKVFGADLLKYNHVFLDLVFIIITISFAAIFMSSPYLNYRTIKDDPFSKRMAFLRSLPISVPILAFSRTLVMLITLLIMTSTFYITLAIALPESFFELFTPFEFIIFILFWFGYSLALGGVNPFIEYGTNGKVLWLFPFIIILAFFIIEFIYYYLIGQGIVESLLLFIKNFGWPVGFISLIIGVLGCYIWNKMLTIRLMKRDYV